MVEEIMPELSERMTYLVREMLGTMSSSRDAG